MESVFLGGSIRIRTLPLEVKNRIDSIVAKRFRIIVGDANGVDRAIQEYLAFVNYPNVEVFCVNASRNNLGNWKVRIVADINKKELELSDYIIKDEAMAREAQYGFMIWDGESSGTLNNILNLVANGKQCLVFKKWSDTFETISGIKDVEELITHAGANKISKIDRKIHLFDRISELRQGILIPHFR